MLNLLLFRKSLKEGAEWVFRKIPANCERKRLETIFQTTTDFCQEKNSVLNPIFDPIITLFELVKPTAKLRGTEFASSVEANARTGFKAEL